MNVPTQLSPRVAALLAKTRAVRGRVIFAVDATGSRELVWDMACQLQSEMFAEVAKIGGLEIQLVFYRGTNQCSHTAWTPDAVALAAQMRRIRCEAGSTQIGRVLRHVRAEHARKKVDAAIFVGDACEEVPADLYNAAADSLPPCFLFQEGDGLVVHLDRHGYPVDDRPQQKVEQVFRELARLSGGAYARFDADVVASLGELLRAVAAFSAGGLAALANQHTDGARKLLGQMRKG
jgi:hypothetical protein